MTGTDDSADKIERAVQSALSANVGSRSIRSHAETRENGVEGFTGLLRRIAEGIDACTMDKDIAVAMVRMSLLPNAASSGEFSEATTPRSESAARALETQAGKLAEHAVTALMDALGKTPPGRKNGKPR